ncbi:MAG: hypothetical protein ACHQYQ_10770 [Bacteriovoracales bacterium]|jgi:hypothetical protein
MKRFLWILFLLLFGACSLTSSRPKEEMSLAAAAFIAAREANAHISAPDLYRKAEYYLLKARETYRKKYFDQARDYALLAKKFAENAEFVALKKATLEEQ